LAKCFYVRGEKRWLKNNTKGKRRKRKKKGCNHLNEASGAPKPSPKTKKRKKEKRTTLSKTLWSDRFGTSQGRKKNKSGKRSVGRRKQEGGSNLMVPPKIISHRHGGLRGSLLGLWELQAENQAC